MKFKSKLSLLGLSLLISGVNVHAMDADNRYEVGIKRMMGGSFIVRHNGTYEGLARGYAKASGDDVNKIRFIWGGYTLPTDYDCSCNFQTALSAVPLIKPVKAVNEITEGKTDAYKVVTDRLKRKLGVFEENRKVFLDRVKNQQYSTCGEPLLQFSAALDDAASMYKLNIQNREEMQSLVLRTFKVNPDIYKPENEDELLKITSLYDSKGIKKSNGAMSMIWDFNENMSQLPLPEQATYIQTLENFFKENTIRNNIFASLIIGYAIKNPEQPKEKYEINRYVIENFQLGDRAAANDWLTCPLKVARQVIEQFNTEAGNSGLTFGDIIISTRQFHKELKDGDKITY